ncbi:hypothetical protein GCM10018793_67720 [Streptomyces sulfonofaciens]|uniref:PknH-like extracellular domain-containing protein n=1 Tax=Streptomyces sulfonofaciens TaxID=68272 RepID=A0A919GR57_9ACTN|nr:hypothetical protein [Streptomyces sulfonofaciens]GHH88350.1 hypothetical protein GCM10018793_67720 [Streptomyces sulfonofaciens]
MTIRRRHARTRARTALTALATGAVLALAAPSATAATAADGPGFLDPAELPPHPSSPWYGGPVTAGQPDPLPACVGDALPSTSVHRAYWTDLDTSALQVTVVERDQQRAADFAALLRSDLADCATNLEQDPDITAVGKDYGKVDVEEGAHVYGVHTTTSWGASDIALFSVGRDGTTVTVVKWSQMGTFGDAPVKAFKTTTRTAVDKLS